MTIPIAHSAQELGEHFVRLFRDGDTDTLAELYEDDALFAPAPGQEARGRTEIAAALRALRAAGATIELKLARIHEVGDIAVYSNIATVGGVNPDGSDLVAPTIEVARRQPDGTWRYVVDDPAFLSFLA
ncbi:hypothetical protein Aph01nite_10010 [Acrocarpospora phusangensis]|uniref:SnoaL-like domain-containing protein n=1 Tax=Acrocarpospora phusangensis TaxID=1070424 RepID=A0A919Q5T7_9ACTN|nr:SgcJ/EcaC family oxidoreductase [Acrocarpospora phusangensis]GIH22691.1 hypothetical protein Aph01nite_10010 [Acrocarpospora phusangensis]